MVQKPSIFISSTGDLRSARDLVAKVLYAMGYEPVWQDIEPTDGGELLDLLRRRMAPCVSMIQLVGQRYGAEPPLDRQPPEFGRVSYTQFEARYFEETLYRQVIYLFLDSGFPTDAAPLEAAELAALQQDYFARIKRANRLRQSGIGSSEVLELTVRRMSDELAVLRRMSEARYRRMLLLAGATLVAIVALAAGSVIGLRLLHRGQAEQTAKIDRQAAAATQQSAKSDDLSRQLARIEQQLESQKQNSPNAAPILSDADLAVLAEAKNEGDLKTQAQASVLKPDANTDALLAELQAKHDSDEFDLAMLQGKRWYFEKVPEFDKALSYFDRAMVLRPERLEPRMYAAGAQTFARMGDLAAHRKRAINICESTLSLVPPQSMSWAMIEFFLGNAWENLPSDEHTESHKKAIACYEAALTVCTNQSAPYDWAQLQNNLGVALTDLPTGDRSENLTRAIGVYEAALTVRTKDAFASDWAATQNNLGNALVVLPTGDRAANLQRAIACYESALTVRTKDGNSFDWATTQNGLGNAWSYLPTGDRTENLKNAVVCYQNALLARTKQADPSDWAMTQNNLGNAWVSLLSGDRAANLKTAIAYYESALTVYTKEGEAHNWAKLQNCLGIATQDLPTGIRAENLTKAINYYEAALTVFTKRDSPIEWAETQNNLATAWAELPAGERESNLQKAISCFEAALTVHTKSGDPHDWAGTQFNLGDAWQNLPGGDKNEHLKNAMVCFEAALTVFTRNTFPLEWAATQEDYGETLSKLEGGQRNENLHRANERFRGALDVFRKDRFPEGWAETQRHWADALQKLADQPGEDGIACLQQAIARDKAALTVYTAEAYPQEHMETAKELSLIRDSYKAGDGEKQAPFDGIPPAH